MVFKPCTQLRSWPVDVRTAMSNYNTEVRLIVKKTQTGFECGNDQNHQTVVLPRY